MIDRCQDADWDLFAMGALDAGVHRQMEEHLRSGCADCRRSYDAAMEMMTALASEAPQVEPSAGIAEALRLRIAEPRGGAEEGFRPGIQPQWMERPRIEPPKIEPPKFEPPKFEPQKIEARPAQRRKPGWAAALPWSIAAALALVALWLGVRLLQVSQELARSNGNSIVVPGPAPSPALGAAQASGEPPRGVARPSTSDGGAGTSGAVAAGTVASKDTDAARVAAMTEQLARLQAERDAAVAQLSEAQSSLAQGVAERSALQAQLAAAQEQAAGRPSGSGDAHDAHPEVAALTDQLSQANATIAGLRGAVARDGRMLAFFQAGSSRQIDLKSIDAGANGAAGIAYYAPDRGLLVLVRNLPQLPGGECYQLWSVHKSGTAITSVGLMATDGVGGGYLFAKPSSELRQLSALAITDEPKGGSISARGRKLLFGALE